MGEGGDRLRRLGLAAMLDSLSHWRDRYRRQRGQTGAPCGVPDRARRRLDRPPRPKASASTARGSAASAARLKEMEADVHSVVIVRHGKLVFEQYYPGYDEPWGEAGARHDIRRHHQTRHALGLEERGLAAGRHRDRPQADRQRRRAGRQILSGTCRRQIRRAGTRSRCDIC